MNVWKNLFIFSLKDLDSYVRFKCKVYSFSWLLGCCILCICPRCGTIQARIILSSSFSNILKCQLSWCCNSLFVMSICRLWKYGQIFWSSALFISSSSELGVCLFFCLNIGQLFYRTARSPTELVTSVPWWQTSTGRSCTEASSYTLEMWRAQKERWAPPLSKDEGRIHLNPFPFTAWANGNNVFSCCVEVEANGRRCNFLCHYVEASVTMLCLLSHL